MGCQTWRSSKLLGRKGRNWFGQPAFIADKRGNRFDTAEGRELGGICGAEQERDNASQCFNMSSRGFVFERTHVSGFCTDGFGLQADVDVCRPFQLFEFAMPPLYK